MCAAENREKPQIPRLNLRQRPKSDSTNGKPYETKPLPALETAGVSELKRQVDLLWHERETLKKSNQLLKRSVESTQRQVDDLQDELSHQRQLTARLSVENGQPAPTVDWAQRLADTLLSAPAALGCEEHRKVCVLKVPGVSKYIACNVNGTVVATERLEAAAIFIFGGRNFASNPWTTRGLRTLFTSPAAAVEGLKLEMVSQQWKGEQDQLTLLGSLQYCGPFSDLKGGYLRCLRSGSLVVEPALLFATDHVFAFRCEGGWRATPLRATIFSPAAGCYLEVSSQGTLKWVAEKKATTWAPSCLEFLDLAEVVGVHGGRSTTASSSAVEPQLMGLEDSDGEVGEESESTALYSQLDWTG